MKRRFACCLLVLAGLMFSSCTKDEAGDETDSVDLAKLIEAPDYEIISEEYLTAEEMADKLFGKDGANGSSLDLSQARARFLEMDRKKCDSLANALGQNGVVTHYGLVNYNYTSVDQFGKSIILSSVVAWGEYWLFGDHMLDQNHIYLTCPYTHTKESECATEDEGGWELTFQTTDILFIMPDGQGFGKTKNTTQMYLNHNVQARQIYDALVAGYRLYTKDCGGKMEDDWKLRVCGASQGAGDAIAVHKYLDTHYQLANGRNELLKDIWRFDYSYVSSGPYCPAETMRQYFKWGELVYPCVLPMVIQSMRASYPDFAAKYPEEAFYTAKYLENKEHFDKVFLEKTLTADDLNADLISKLNPDANKYKDVKKMPLSWMLNEEVLNLDSPISKALLECLDDQDLTKGWTPKTDTYLHYSPDDDVVPYVNTQMLQKLFGSKAHMDEALYAGGHVTTCKQFMLSVW